MLGVPTTVTYTNGKVERFASVWFNFGEIYISNKKDPKNKDFVKKDIKTVKMIEKFWDDSTSTVFVPYEATVLASNGKLKKNDYSMTDIALFIPTEVVGISLLVLALTDGKALVAPKSNKPYDLYMYRSDIGVAVSCRYGGYSDKIMKETIIKHIEEDQELVKHIKSRKDFLSNDENLYDFMTDILTEFITWWEKNKGK